jgi:hypothetical protein
MADSTRLLAVARATPLTQYGVSAMSEEDSEEALLDALRTAVSTNDSAAMVLAFALVVHGADVPADLLVRLLPDLDDPSQMLTLAGCCEGDVTAMILEVIETGRLSVEREAALIYVAARLQEGNLPRVLVGRLRTILREPFWSPSVRIVAGLAATLTGDVEVQRLAQEAVPVGLIDGLRASIGDRLWKLFREPTVDVLPVQNQTRLWGGYTVVRETPKVGRNEPCPCGSGKKFKKCCEGVEARQPVPQTAIERFLLTKGRQRRVAWDLLHASEIERLDPSLLGWEELLDGMRRLVTSRRWEGAHRMLDALASRPDLGQPVADYREEFIYHAIRERALDAADREWSLLPADHPSRAHLRLELDIAGHVPHALEQLEAALAESLRESSSRATDLAFLLLDWFPATGIYLARGALRGDRLLDSDELLRSIGEARDRLDLPAEDPFEEIFDRMLEEEANEVAQRSEEEASEDVVEELEALRRNLREGSAQRARLERELSRRQRELDEATAERERLKKLAVAGEAARIHELEEEKKRLRLKIESLRGTLAESVEERSRLRLDLARSTSTRQALPIGHPTDATEREADEMEGDAVDTVPRRVLIPSYSAATTRALTTIPRRVASDALEVTARLAGGDPGTWAQARHTRRNRDVHSIRLARTWRLLFRVADPALEVLDVIHRKELEQALARIG